MQRERRVDMLKVVSRNQILSAAFKSVNAAATESLKTPNVHSELVTNLSASNNVSTSFQTVESVKHEADDEVRSQKHTADMA